VLEQAIERGVIDNYYLKGGVAMELGFARAARTTKDFDLGLVGNRAERIRKLEEVLKLGFDAFTFRLKPEMHQMEVADTVRVEVCGSIQDAILANGGHRSWSGRSARSGLGSASRPRHRRNGLAGGRPRR